MIIFVQFVHITLELYGFRVAIANFKICLILYFQLEDNRIVRPSAHGYKQPILGGNIKFPKRRTTKKLQKRPSRDLFLSLKSPSAGQRCRPIIPNQLRFCPPQYRASQSHLLFPRRQCPQRSWNGNFCRFSKHC